MRSTESDVILPVEKELSSGPELFKVLAFVVGVLAGGSAINGLLLVIGREAAGRSVLQFSGAAWLVWFGLRMAHKMRERARTARPSGHIRLTSSEIAVPSLSHEIKFLQKDSIQTVRWMDLKKVRLTRDVVGETYYEFFSGAETPTILFERSRVKDAAALDRELEARSSKFERTFEWERPASGAPGPERSKEIPPGERFELSLPSTVWHTLRGCGGMLLALAIAFGLAWHLPGAALRWMTEPAGMAVLMTGMIAVLLVVIFLATRSSPSPAWIVCGADGLHIRAPGVSFPPFIGWSELRDYTYSSTGGRNPSRNVTVWTPEGSWKLKRVRIRDERKLLSILAQRSARRPQAFLERSGGCLGLDTL
jgi:hypothetical protein